MKKPKVIRRSKAAMKKSLKQLDDYLTRGINLYDRTPALQEKYSSPRDPDYSKYIDTEAILYIREIQEVGVPFPSWQDMLTVGGETDLRIFLSIGYACYSSVRKNLSTNLDTTANILDFGAGCARTMRFFFREQDRFNCHACDVDRKAIKYLEESVPFIEPKVCGNLPPLPYPSEFFEYVYSISVFTHIKLDAFMIWLEELSRVIKPGGILQMSLHGEKAFSQLENEPDRRRLIGVAEEEFQNTKTHFTDTGFLWMKQPVGSEDIDTQQFGISFMTVEKFREISSIEFLLLEYLPGEIGDWQDLAIMKRKNKK